MHAGAVVPYVGTWIEMRTRRALGVSDDVVPYVGTWIEIHTIFEWQKLNASRSLRGNVDRNSTKRTNKQIGGMSFPTWERG